MADRAEPLNKINVFPVPDGDTGTNVASTLQKMAAGVARMRQRDVREMSRALADEAVGAARGNSGAILAQFFCGFAEGLPKAPRVGTGDFGRAMVLAADSAYGAIARPVEGTILTVIRDWARFVARRGGRSPGLRAAASRVARRGAPVAREHAEPDEGSRQGRRRRRGSAGVRVSARGDRPIPPGFVAPVGPGGSSGGRAGGGFRQDFGRDSVPLLYGSPARGRPDRPRPSSPRGRAARRLDRRRGRRGAGPPPRPHQRARAPVRHSRPARGGRPDQDRRHAGAARDAVRPEPPRARRGRDGLDLRSAGFDGRGPRDRGGTGPRLLRLGELPRQGHDHAVRVLCAFLRDRRGAEDFPAAARRFHAGIPERRDARRRDRLDQSVVRSVGHLPGVDRRRAARRKDRVRARRQPERLRRPRLDRPRRGGGRPGGQAGGGGRPDRAGRRGAHAALHRRSDARAPRPRGPGVALEELDRPAARPASRADAHARREGRARRQGAGATTERAAR